MQYELYCLAVGVCVCGGGGGVWGGVGAEGVGAEQVSGEDRGRVMAFLHAEFRFPTFFRNFDRSNTCFKDALCVF